MKKEYFDLKNEFHILHKLSDKINIIHEIRNTYPQLENIPLKDVEKFLCKEYGEVDNKLAEQLKLN